MGSQTRRSVSINGLKYQRMASMCEDDGESVSAYVTRLIMADMDRKGRPIETVLKPRPKRRGPAASGVHLF